MPDQHDSAQRPRPFVPPVRPFRGPATAARQQPTPPASPNGTRSAAPFVARRPWKIDELPVAAPAELAAEAAHAVIVPERASIAAATLSATEPAPTRPATSGDDAHLYGRDPFSTVAATAVATPVGTPSRTAPETDARPDEAATDLEGLPFFAADGDAHEAGGERSRLHSSGKLHRVEFDPAAVLGSIAERIRSGALQVPGLDPHASEGATLAAILAALLRNSHR